MKSTEKTAAKRAAQRREIRPMRLKRTVLLSLAALVTAASPISGGLALAQTAPGGQPAQAPTVFDQHAGQGKIATCANLFGALGRGLVTGTTYTAQSHWNQSAGNAHTVQSLVAMKPATKAPGQPTAGVVFAAPVGGACEGGVVKVTPTAQSCPALAADLVKQNGRSAVVGDLTVVTLPNGEQIMLLPWQNACVAVATLQTAG